MKKKFLAMLLIAVMMLSGLNGYVSAEAATKLKTPKGVTVKTSSKKVYPVISWKKVSRPRNTGFTEKPRPINLGLRLAQPQSSRLKIPNGKPKKAP